MFYDGNVEEGGVLGFVVGVDLVRGWVASGEGYVRGGITVEGIE